VAKASTFEPASAPSEVFVSALQLKLREIGVVSLGLPVEKFRCPNPSNLIIDG
jgi:hypothetical protein